MIYYVAEPAAPSTQYANRMSTKVDTQLAPEEAEEAAQGSELSTGSGPTPDHRGGRPQGNTSKQSHLDLQRNRCIARKPFTAVLPA